MPTQDVKYLSYLLRNHYSGPTRPAPQPLPVAPSTGSAQITSVTHQTPAQIAALAALVAKHKAQIAKHNAWLASRHAPRPGVFGKGS